MKRWWLGVVLGLLMLAAMGIAWYHGRTHPSSSAALVKPVDEHALKHLEHMLSAWETPETPEAPSQP